MNAGRRGLTNAGEDEVTAIKESHELIEKSICQIRICVTRTTMAICQALQMEVIMNTVSVHVVLLGLRIREHGRG
jgi:hypothetical protein